MILLRKFNLLVVLGITVCIMSVGCNQSSEQIVETTQSQEIKLDIQNELDGKYFIEMPYKEGDNVVMGIIGYFNDDSVKLIHTPFYEDFYNNLECTSVVRENNSIIYNINDTSESSENKEVKLIVSVKENGVFQYQWLNRQPVDLVLMNKDDIVETINTNSDFFYLGNLDKQTLELFNLENSGVKQEKISKEEAVLIIRKLLNDSYWDCTGLFTINGKDYYAIEEMEVGADYRYMIDAYTSEIFVETSGNLGYLEPYREANDNSINKEEFSTREALELTLKYFGLEADEIEDTWSISDNISFETRLDEPMFKDGELYHQIALRLPNTEGTFALSDYWYVSNSGKVYSSREGFGDTPSDITSNLVDPNTFK